jgi:hypothetical protein
VDRNFYNSPILACFLKFKNHCVRSLRANSKNVHPLVKNKKLKKGEGRGQHSGDMTVLAFEDRKQRTPSIRQHLHKLSSFNSNSFSVWSMLRCYKQDELMHRAREQRESLETIHWRRVSKQSCC